MNKPAVCDRCGKPMLDGQTRYSLADEFDDDGNWVGGRHYECHQLRGQEMEKALERMRKSGEELGALMEELGRSNPFKRSR
jgi:hypothetical protein